MLTFLIGMEFVDLNICILDLRIFRWRFPEQGAEIRLDRDWPDKFSKIEHMPSERTISRSVLTVRPYVNAARSLARDLMDAWIKPTCA
jgi:hypothetical protein